MTFAPKNTYIRNPPRVFLLRLISVENLLNQSVSNEVDQVRSSAQAHRLETQDTLIEITVNAIKISMYAIKFYKGISLRSIMEWIL